MNSKNSRKKSARRTKTTALPVKRKWYHLDPKKHGLGGVTHLKPVKRKPDRRASPWEGYAVIFFPQYKVGFKAQVGFQSTNDTLSQTAEAARVRFADNIGGEGSPDLKWAEYHLAGHRVRRVRIVDLGPAVDSK